MRLVPDDPGLYAHRTRSNVIRISGVVSPVVGEKDDVASVQHAGQPVPSASCETELDSSSPSSQPQH
jgi:hypothetical protein